MFKFLLVLIDVVVTVFASEAAPYDVSNIRLLHVVFRHGERAPADTYPNDPYISYPFEPYGWGQLTTTGRARQYEAGQFLRQRYNAFLDDVYHPDIVSVRSTGVDRSIMSAQLEMAGMWPPKEAQRWNANVDWQPISMKIDSIDNDTLLLVRVPCPKYSKKVEEVLTSEEVQNELLPYKDMMEYLEKHSGKTIRTADDVNDLYSTLNAEKEFGVILPEWTEKYFPDKMVYLSARSFVYNVKTPYLQRIKGGPLLKKILNDSKVIASQGTKSTRRKLYMYCGHDATVVNFLSTLRVWESQFPDFGITALVEVHEDPRTNQYGLKVFLRNSTTEEPYPLEIPDCGYFCPLEKMTDLYQNVLPDDLASECISDDPYYVPPPPSGP